MITVFDLPEIPVNSRMDWSKKLRKLRKDLGVDQSEMAHLLGFSSAVRVSELENGRNRITNQTIKCMEYLERLHRNNLL